MKCEFWMTGRFTVSFPTWGEIYEGYTRLEDAVNRVSECWDEGSGMTADIVDAETGEVLLHFEDEERDPDDWDEDPWDEMGYNPYTGGYDWDC